MPKFYIQRKLYIGDKLIVDSELIGRSGIFVVLAEPGAGKSDLLDFLSSSYGITREPGSLFVHRAPIEQTVLIIDALDEVARIGEEKINEIIVKARASSANTVIFASRSYLWDAARNVAVRDCFGTDPTVLRLEPSPLVVRSAPKAVGRGISGLGVRRAKAALSSGCKSHPATAPTGSNRSSHGGNEVAETFD